MDGRRVGEGANRVNCRPDRGRYIASGRTSAAVPGDSDVRPPRRTEALARAARFCRPTIYVNVGRSHYCRAVVVL